VAISDLRFGSTDRNILDDFEKSLGSKLPFDYKLFLESSNGGCLSSNTFKVSYLDDTIELDVLFGLGTERDFDLRVWRQEYQDDLPQDKLVIGGDPYGNLFVLGLEKSGIYLWDQIRRFEKSSDIGNAYLVGENFTQFVKKLTQESSDKIVGPLGTKLLQNVWHDAGNGTKQEINRLVYVAFSRVNGFNLTER